MRQEKSPLLRLEEIASFQKVCCLNINEVLDKDHRILQVKTSCLLNPELLDDALQRMQKNLVDAPVVASQSDFRKEMMRCFRNVKREFVGHISIVPLRA